MLIRLIRAMSRGTQQSVSTRSGHPHAVAAALVALAAAVGGCAHDAQTHSGPQPTVSTPLAAPRGTRVEGRSSAPDVVSQDAAPAPAATRAGIAAVPAASLPATSASPPSSPATPGGPRIDSIVVTPAIVHAGDTVRWDVRTSPDIVMVTAHVAVYTFTFARLGPGRFDLKFPIPPNVPPMFRGHYSLTVNAKNAAGANAAKIVGLTFE